MVGHRLVKYQCVGSVGLRVYIYLRNKHCELLS
jgi:hypothetical protein